MLAVKILWHFALACAMAAMGAGIWFGYQAWQLGSQRYGMLAVVLLVSAPMLMAALMLSWPCDRADNSATPCGVLVAAIDRIDATLRIVRFCRAHLGVAGSFVFVLWFCQLTGYVRLIEFLVFYTVTCAVAAAALMPWLASSERRLYDERAEYRQRLGEIEVSLQNPDRMSRDVN